MQRKSSSGYRTFDPEYTGAAFLAYARHVRHSSIRCMLNMYICRLKLEGEELAKYGAAKPLDQQGIDKYAETPVQKGANYCEDPTGRRTGHGMRHQVQQFQ